MSASREGRASSAFQLQARILKILVLWLASGGRASGLVLKARPNKYLLASSSTNGTVSYSLLPETGLATNASFRDLITGLSSPMGLAVDSRKRRLFVADPGATCIYMFSLTSDDRKMLRADAGQRVLNGTEVRWIAVDSVGNLLYSDEIGNQLVRIRVNGTNVSSPEVLYNTTSVEEVSQPGGIAADTFYVYWVNKALGTSLGSLLRAPLEADSQNPGGFVEVLSQNVDTAYGLCQAMSNSFYTVSNASVYGSKSAWGTVQLITDRLEEPRGCVWDGENTVYVADHGLDGVYSFASNMQELKPSRMERSFYLQGAYGSAVFVSLGCSSSTLAAGILSLAAAASCWSMRPLHL